MPLQNNRGLGVGQRAHCKTWKGIRRCIFLYKMIKCRNLDRYGNTKFLAHPDLVSRARVGVGGARACDSQSVDKDENMSLLAPYQSVLNCACLIK